MTEVQNNLEKEQIDERNPEINNGNTETNSEEKVRIDSIDVLKGLAICFVILAHMCMVNLMGWTKFVLWIIYLVLDVFGPSLFVVLSVLSTSFSVSLKRGKVDEKEIRDTVIGRAIPLWIIGVIQNYGMGKANLGILKFWGWGIFFFIAIAQVTTYYVTKMKQRDRLIIALSIIIIYEIILNIVLIGLNNAGLDYVALVQGNMSESDVFNTFLTDPFGFIFFFIFNPLNEEPFLPWIAVPFVIAGIGEALAGVVNDGSKESYKNFNKKILYQGIIFTVIGIILGFSFTHDDLGWGLISGFETSIGILYNDMAGIPYNESFYIPVFLVHSSSANMFYNMGMDLLLLSLCFYICEIKGHKGKIVQFFSFYGKVSLSLFVFHIVIGSLFPGKLTFDIFVYVVLVIIVLYYIMKTWAYKFKMKLTPEFFIIIFGMFYIKTMKKMREKAIKVE
ncbi:MAG: hypothetical protein GY870_00950 [archaeon]|nr:hypothetical protein [archaeon]